MELKPGYKQTEIGVIPEDWRVRQLGDVCSVLRGGSPRPIENYITDKEDGINWIKIGDVGAGAKYIDTTSEKILPSGVSRSRHVKRGDFLLSNSMSFGRPYILRTEGCIHDGWLVIGDYRHSFDTDYLYYCLSSNAVLSQYARYAAGSSVLNLNKDIVSKVHVAIPEPNEQSRISEVLSALDELIDQLAGLVTKKRNMKQAAMQELLTGKRRLPGFEGEWEEFSLGSVASMNSGGTPPTGRDDYYGGGIPWVSISDMTSGGKFISQTERTLSAAGLTNCAAKQFPAGTILYAMYASLGECSIAATEVTSSQAILGIRPGASLHNEFLFYYLSSIHDKVKLMGQQGTQSNLNKGIVQGFILRLPDKAEQIAIAEALGNIDQELDALSMKAQKIREIKAGMMQQLLTGKIRLT